MTARPIIFSAPMVQALIDGRKTQTRRLLKLAGRRPDFVGPRGCTDDPTCWGWEDSNHGDHVTIEREPGQRMGWRDWRGAYHVGDRLYVREAVRFADEWNDCPPSQFDRSDAIRYEADGTQETRAWGDPFQPGRLRPSIHMPRWASRLTLTVTDVRVQRLQDISEADCVAEGIERMKSGRGFYDPTAPKGTVRFGNWTSTAKQGYRTLWNSLHGPDA